MTKKGQSQSDKFKKTARDLGVDLDEDKLKEALRKLGGQKPGTGPDTTKSADPDGKAKR